MQPFKVYFEKDSEIRRFNLESSCGEELFALLCQRISGVLGHQEFRIFWKDSEGDSISCDSDDELKVALDANKHLLDPVLRVFVKAAPQPPPQQSTTTATLEVPAYPHGTEKHPGVLCDGCDSAIVGTRYKCLTCEDFDLCVKCEFKGLHREHDTVAIRKPNRNEWRKLFSVSHMAYGVRHPNPVGLNEFVHPPPPKFQPFWQRQDPTVELDLNLNQPLENLLKDVNMQVQKVLKGFMPQTIPEVPVVTVPMVPQVVVPQMLVPEVPQRETFQEVVVREKIQVVDKLAEQVETLHEVVFEHGAATPEEKSAIESIYPHLVTASEQAELISIAESYRSDSPTFEVQSSTSTEVENGWAYVTAEEETTVDATTETESSTQTSHETAGAQIEAALNAMEEMGFKNEGNLLRALLENFNGDIGKVLDTIN